MSFLMSLESASLRLVHYSLRIIMPEFLSMAMCSVTFDYDKCDAMGFKRGEDRPLSATAKSCSYARTCDRMRCCKKYHCGLNYSSVLKMQTKIEQLEAGFQRNGAPSAQGFIPSAKTWSCERGQSSIPVFAQSVTLITP